MSRRIKNIAQFFGRTAPLIQEGDKIPSASATKHNRDDRTARGASELVVAPPNDELTASWTYMEDVLQKIYLSFENGIDMQTYMGFYTGVHNYCTTDSGRDPANNSSSRGARLSGGLFYQQMSDHIDMHVTAIREASQDKSSEALLEFLVNQWKKYEVAARLINHLSRYLNRHFVKRQLDEGGKGFYDVYTLHMVQWKTRMFDFLHEKAMESVLSLVQRQRNGEGVGYAEIKKYVDSFVALNIDDGDNIENTLGIDMYKTVFEKPFCAASLIYYQQASAEFLGKHSLIEFMKFVEDRLYEEEYHTAMYLLNELTGPLISACEQALIVDHLEVIHEQFIILIQCQDQRNLARLYRLLSRIPGGLDPLRSQFESHVQATGLKSINCALGGGNMLSPSDYVATLSRIISTYENMVAITFKQDIEFKRSLEKACMVIVNRNEMCKSNQTKSSELLVLDTTALLMHSSPETVQEDELYTSIQKIITVFKHLEDKDSFQKFYSRKLAHRLLYSSAVYQDTERMFISQLKEVCDVRFWNALQAMLQDLQTSKDLNSSFRDLHRSDPFIDCNTIRIDDSYRVLSSASVWHLRAPDTEFKPPVVVQETCARFTDFYDSQHKGRRLTWQWQLCEGELTTNYVHLVGKPYQFRVSAYQMAILLLFNDTNEVSHGYIKTTTQLSGSVLDRTIGSLVKFRVLNMHPPTPAEGLSYSLNYDFRSKRVRVNLIVASKSQKIQESEETNKAIIEERRLVIKCACVRVMKFRKQMSYRELVAEVIQQLLARFTASKSDVKICIDDLIEKEFLRRIEEDKLEYLA